MANFLLAILSVILFAVSLRGLLATSSENLRLAALQGDYSMLALRVGRSYRLAAWGALSVFFFLTLSYLLFQIIAS